MEDVATGGGKELFKERYGEMLETLMRGVRIDEATPCAFPFEQDLLAQLVGTREVCLSVEPLNP